MAAIFTIQARAAADAAARPPARPTDRPSAAPPASPLTRLSHPQATLGYFLMLVAMTYQGELFIAVIAGLGLGHGAFNVHAPVAGTDACCVEPAPPTAKQQGEKEVLTEVSARVAAGVTPVEAAPPVTTVLAVEGMTCDGCTATVVAALAAVPGVDAVQVSLSEGTATVRGAAPPAELRARVVARPRRARPRDPSVPAGVPVGAEHVAAATTCWSPPRPRRSCSEKAAQRHASVFSQQNIVDTRAAGGARSRAADLAPAAVRSPRADSRLLAERRAPAVHTPEWPGGP